MRIFILDRTYVIGFANSLEELQDCNNKRSYPYNFDWSKVTSRELTPDVFNPATIEGHSNFADYVKY